MLRRFREARAGGGSAAELARPLDQGLDERQRQQQLKQWAATMIPSTTATAAVDPRQPQFDRGQAAIVAAWSAQPASLRDPAVLARQLDALRAQTFTRTGQ